MSDPDMIEKIIDSVSIPVMAKARIGHFVEAQVLQSLGVDYIDESEVLTPADYIHHVDKWNFTVPFVSGAINLGEALRRINKGAAMIRSKGEAGTGDVSNATGHMRKIRSEIAKLPPCLRTSCTSRPRNCRPRTNWSRKSSQPASSPCYSRWHRHPGRRGHDDAARCRRRVPQLRHLRVRQPRPARRRRQGHHLLQRPDVIAKASRGLGEAMVGINVDEIPQPHRPAERGW